MKFILSVFAILMVLAVLIFAPMAGALDLPDGFHIQTNQCHEFRCVSNCYTGGPHAARVMAVYEAFGVPDTWFDEEKETHCVTMRVDSTLDVVYDWHKQPRGHLIYPKIPDEFTIYQDEDNKWRWHDGGMGYSRQQYTSETQARYGALAYDALRKSGDTEALKKIFTDSLHD